MKYGLPEHKTALFEELRGITLSIMFVFVTFHLSTTSIAFLIPIKENWINIMQLHPYVTAVLQTLVEKSIYITYVSVLASMAILMFYNG